MHAQYLLTATPAPDSSPQTPLKTPQQQEAMAKMAKGAKGGGGSAASLNNMLMQMRKNCNHPDLITSAYDGSSVYPPPEELVADCGKMALAERLLNRLLPEGHKVLVFSQMTSMLDIWESYLEAKGVESCRIDGAVAWQDRQAAMKVGGWGGALVGDVGFGFAQGLHAWAWARPAGGLLAWMAPPLPCNICTCTATNPPRLPLLLPRHLNSPLCPNPPTLLPPALQRGPRLQGLPALHARRRAGHQPHRRRHLHVRLSAGVAGLVGASE